MLQCSINDIQSGVTIAAAVMHPARPETELVKPGLTLSGEVLARLKDFGVEYIWVDHDATSDLDNQIQIGPSPAHQAMYEKLKGSIQTAEASTISSGDVQSYRQAVMEMVCELMGNPALATLAERMNRSNDGEMLRHGANVAYLSILIGLQMQAYIIKQRSKLSTEHAKDLTALGIGAMLHDVGKIAEPAKDARDLNALAEHRLLQAAGEDLQAHQELLARCGAYRNHTIVGYRMLQAANAPASAKQIVLAHHQRWDGTGFPKMDKVTNGRVPGTQSGEQIHIFSRIVAAADLLDHLLHEAVLAGQPVIAALNAFRDAAFESWLDPIIFDAVLRTVPPFPVASHVKLSDGRSAVVITPNPVQPCLPTLRILDQERGENAEPLALAEHRDITITHLLGEPIEAHIFLIPEQEPLIKRMARMG